MGSWSAIDLSGTGLDMARLWLDTVSHNMSNLNTVRPSDEEPFRALLLEVQEGTESISRAGGGVEVVGIRENGAAPQLAYDPDNPLANDDGYVVQPVIDITTQMTDLIIATRMYQLNIQAMQSNQEAYESALRIGNGR